jgi:phosphodiesterase/alkaline phosphatase D-like protein
MAKAFRINTGPVCGAVTSTSAVIKAAVVRDVSQAAVLIDNSSSFPAPRRVNASGSWVDPEKEYEDRILTFPVSDLSPGTPFHYVLELDGVVQDNRPGRFTTYPARGTHTSFRFACASCSGNRKLIFDPFLSPEVYTMLAAEPDLTFFFHLGDLLYDIDDTVIGKRLEKYHWMFARKEVASLFRTLPFEYTWDDHDFLGNNSIGGDAANAAAKRTALDAYDVFWPHHPLANGNDGLYRRFEVGDVLFLALDTRFNRSPKGSGTSGKTMLGQNQKDWLKRQLEDASAYDLVVVANSVPWIAEPDPDDDHWGGYATERQEIATFVKQKNIRNLCMISGDAHMLAADDGTNSGYAAGGGGGFPILHASALESKKSSKGGPYSLSTFPGRRQYGIVEIDYGAGTSPTVRFRGRRGEEDGATLADVEEVFTLEFKAAQTFSGF